jgi:RHS repeat-associated protein
MQAAIRRRYRYDPSGQLTGLDDTRRGHIEYRYDPVGRLLAANSAMGHETFAFDPAGNIQVPNNTQHQSSATRVPLPKVLDNLLKEYAGTSYRYDERGNLVERRQNAERDSFEWDAFNRMTRATTRHGVTTFAYDPLGRRIAKHSQAMEGTGLRHATRTIYGWDGDTLALESGVYPGPAGGERTVHYVYERDSFIPLVQATRSRALQLAPTTDVKLLMAGNDGQYDIALDPLWNGDAEQEAEPFGENEIAFYQCDQLGTPQELTDCDGKVAWSAQYKAWGQAKEAISDAAHKAGMRNPIRFQGQYLDDETGLHYTRFRYYDPYLGRFVSKDPIGLLGGEHLYSYAANPLEWVDPLGLTRTRNSPHLTAAAGKASKCEATFTSNQARREALRRAGVPTSATPFAQRTLSGIYTGRVPAPQGMEQYAYRVESIDGARLMILSHHKQDKDHACSHWHVGEAKSLGSDGMPTAFENGAWKYQTGGPVVEHR